MHDPEVVVFTISIPRFWPRAMPTVTDGWHVTRRRRTNPENLGQPVYPWWRLVGYDFVAASRRIGSRPLITVWHVEPDGRDALTVCKGMGGSDLTWHNVRWAWRHRRHLEIAVEPWRRFRRWREDHCDECGRRFFWRDARFGYMSSDDVYHEACMALRDERARRQDYERYLRAEADDTARWRVERHLAELDRRAREDA